MAKDPYRYFRVEAQELLEGLAKGLLALEKGEDTEEVKRLLRLAHTFKGASRVVGRTDIGDLAHQLEDVLSPLRAGEIAVGRDRIDGALGLLDQMGKLVATLTQKPAEHREAPAPEPVANSTAPEARADAEQTIRIPVTELDALLESALEVHSAATALRRSNAELAAVATQARALLSDMTSERQTPAMRRCAADIEELIAALQGCEHTALERTDRVMIELAELRDAASDLRLVPTQSLMGDLERVARDAARELDKDVAISVEGSETHIDAHVLRELRNALIHLVRNCVAHGIEEREKRVLSGKPPIGRIDIIIKRRGHRVSILCRDDGRGLDLDLVRRVAIERKLVSRDQASEMDDEALARLLLHGGVSTSRVVGDISGRGVGLDAVRESMESLNGEVSVQSVSGQGTVVELLAPVSLSSMPTLTLEVDGTTLLLPLDSVQQALRLAPGEIVQDADGERVVVDGQVLPFLSLRCALERPSPEPGDMWSVLVIEAEGLQAAVGADSLGAARSIVIRGIPGHVAPAPIIAGATFDDDGGPLLVLSPGALIRAASSGALVAVAPAPREIPPLLIIDDSLTTRMLEQSILESAGYEVDLATSAEQGLERARKRRYGVFVVDVEMPGMNGFEFIETIRSDTDLCDIPAILVTSRNDPADKLRGKQVGAQAYIVKGEFDQAVLLETIRRLLQ